MKIQESAEMYLETILVLGQKNGQVRSIDIATEMEFSKPSVSFAMKRFRENGYIEVDDAGLITLTKKGREIAESVYERHQVLSKYFISLGVSEDVAQEDACRIEHVISQETFEKMRAHVEQFHS